MEAAEKGLDVFRRAFYLELNLDDVSAAPAALREASKDERELVEAARAELKEGSKDGLARSAINKITDEFLASGDGKPTFSQKLGQLLRATSTQLPHVTLEYRNISVEAKALVGKGSNPSVANSFKAMLCLALCRGGLETRPVQLLRDVNGVLLPGRLTLLLGSPGAGKSLLLNVLSGRLRSGSGLKISGTMRYNGVDPSEFVLNRTAGLVDQQDFHVPTLTVLETVNFAWQCQVSAARRVQYLAEITRAAHRLKKAKTRRLLERQQGLELELAEAGLASTAAASPGPDGPAAPAGAAGEGPAHEVGDDRVGMAAAAAADGSYNDGDARGQWPPAANGLTPAGGGDGSRSSSGGLEGPPGSASGVSGHDKSLGADKSTGGDKSAGSKSAGELLEQALSADFGDGELPPELFDERFFRAAREVVARGLKPHIILGVMGLSHCADTIVGNEMLRGVSGGERKRVTTAEILVGPQSLILMDEISTGLDSATTYSLVRTFRDAAHSLQKTMVISLLQPAPEVIQLFDDILLLSEGRAIYHGPVDQVLPFFLDCGFQCPVRKDLGSFLQEITTPLGQMAYAVPALLQQHGVAEERRTPEALLEAPPKELLLPVDDIADQFWLRSAQGVATLERLQHHPFDRREGPSNALFTTKYASSVFHLTWVVLKRLGLLNLRLKSFYIGRMIQTAVLALIIGSLFGGIEPSAQSSRNVLAVCTLTVIFLAMSSMPQVALVFQTKRVFYKHRDNHLFPPWSHVMGMLLVQVPQSTAECVIYSCVTYWLLDFSGTAQQFFTFLLITWSTSNTSAGLMRLLACAAKSMVIANAAGAMMLLLMAITNGFSIVRTSIPDYMIWIYWINPLAWAIRALSINELTSSRWDIPTPTGLPLGEASLQLFGFYTETYWIWAGVGFLWGSLALYSALGTLALTITNPPSPRPTVPEEEQKAEVTRGLVERLSALVSHAKKLAGAATFVAARQSKPAEHVVVPFTPITLVCRDIRYYVNDPSKGESPGVVKGSEDREIAGKLELLKGISLYAEPGYLTALMGGSGAGKTTLMDVICGRKTQGLIRGEMLVNGHPKNQQTWSRVVGYVEQNDIHSTGLTVKESLMFSARLRLEESITLEQVRSLVRETLEMVELSRLAGMVVGEAGSDVGLSLEQRKRLSIAVELVANPSVVFMDEPTSGLDARAAAIVMRAVQNVARSNRTVMVTIHQPSMEIFEAFHMMLLLQAGGRLTYFGPLGYESSELIAYLQACPGVEPILPGYNPATWMLEVTGGSMTTIFRHAGQDFPAIYAESGICQENEARLEALSGQRSEAPLALAGRYATSRRTQRAWLIRRFFAIYWRSPNYNFVRLIVTVAMALIYGLTYINEGELDPAGVEITTIQNIMGLIFSMTVFLGMFNCLTTQSLVFAERVVFYRERAAAMYAPGAYDLGMGIAEVPYLVAQALVMVAIVYWMVGFQAVAWKFFYFLLMFLAALTMFTFFGQFLVFLTPNLMLASLLAAAANQLWTIFNGFFKPYPIIPTGWKWLNRISPTSWVLAGLAGSQLCDQDIPIINFQGQNVTVSAFMSEYFGYESNMTWWCLLIVVAYLVAFRVGSTLLLNYVSYQRR